MHLIHFRKDYALKVLAALQSGQPIPAPPEGWSGPAMLQVAASVVAMLRAQLPHTWAAAGDAAIQLVAGMEAEAHEVETVDTHRDVMLGVEFLADTCERALRGQDDAMFTPEYRAAVYKRRDGNEHMVVVEGMAHGIDVARQTRGARGGSPPVAATAPPAAAAPPAPPPPARRGRGRPPSS